MPAALVGDSVKQLRSNPYTSVLLTKTVTAGNLLVLCAGVDPNTESVSGVTDTMNGDAWTPASAGATHGSPLNIYRRIYCKVVPAGWGTAETTITIAGSGAPNTVQGTLFEFSGMDTASPVDGDGTGASATGTANPITVNIVTGADNCVVVGVVHSMDGTVAAGANYTDAGLTGDWAGYQVEEYDLDAGAAGTIPVNATATGDNYWLVVAAAFNIAATAPDLVTYRPASDKSNTGGFTTSSGSGTLASHLDEATPDHSDFIQSPANPVSAACEIYWGTISTPSESSNHTFTYWLRSAGGGSMGCEIELYAADGTTLVDAWTVEPVPSTWTEYSRTLDAAAMANWVSGGYGATSFFKVIVWTNT